MVDGFAPAKINLSLHVTRRRADGYHLLDSLVVFADVGDRVSAVPADRLTLAVTGPMAAGVPTDDSNLVLRAARALGVAGAAITLDKHLPAAAGIGGGSSDAAAALRVLAAMTGRDLPADRGLSLGADVPACLTARACRMTGVGEVLAPVPPLPPLFAVLANPGFAVPTPRVFAAMTRRDNAAMPPVPVFSAAPEFCAWLRDRRNDLEPAALSVEPRIGAVLAALAERPNLLVRMSGSGATCFSLHASAAEAAQAALALRANHPDWWVVSTALN